MIGSCSFGKIFHFSNGPEYTGARGFLWKLYIYSYLCLYLFLGYYAIWLDILKAKHINEPYKDHFLHLSPSNM